MGYNFLVDRFGRIWEGRYGGVARPVVGAHTLGYNDDSFAGSGIGNFDIARPPAALVRAFARLFAWKLSLYGVRADAAAAYITSRWFEAINGHRDAGQTACPGRYLYAKLPTIRSLAAGYQRSWAGRQRTLGVAGSRTPAIVARSARSGQAWLIRTTRSGGFSRWTPTGAYPAAADLLVNAGDWDRDGRGDVITRSGRTGELYLYPGRAHGRLGAPIPMARFSFGRVRLLTAVGDMTGDGRPDLIGQPSGGSMRIYPGNGKHGFTKSYVAHSAVSGTQQLGVGLWNSDGAPDTVVRRSNGDLVLYPGNGPGGLTGGTVIGRVSGTYDWVVVAGDLTGDGRLDLVGGSARTGRLWTIPGAAGSLRARSGFASDTGRFDLAGLGTASSRLGVAQPARSRSVARSCSGPGSPTSPRSGVAHPHGGGVPHQGRQHGDQARRGRTGHVGEQPAAAGHHVRAAAACASRAPWLTVPSRVPPGRVLGVRRVEATNTSGWPSTTAP